jgi:uncharacterized protein (TIGR02246 family)
MTDTPDREQGSPEDLAAIRAVVAEVERAQQNELPEEFLAQFRDDAVWTTALGMRLIGMEEIGPFTRKALPGARQRSGAMARYEVERVVWARPDVAVVQIHQIPVTTDGEPIPDDLRDTSPDTTDGRPTYVMTKEADGWKIVCGQNTKAPDNP